VTPAGSADSSNVTQPATDVAAVVASAFPPFAPTLEAPATATPQTGLAVLFGGLGVLGLLTAGGLVAWRIARRGV
jgi:hypothetical protein